MADNLTHPYNQRQVVTIDVLPNDVLLDIFDFYVVEYQALNSVDIVFILQSTEEKIEWWQTLVHVCRRWRGLVFASPHHLNLQLYCTTRTPARATLDVWPALPLLIQGGVTETSVDNVIALLENNDRICQINLECHTSSQFEKLWTAMQAPFPELVVIHLSFRGLSYVSVLPDLFLGGSAPRLRFLALVAVPFPGLTNLLLCTTHLAHLHLRTIPHSGYISPEAMVTCLSMLTSLETFRLEFESPESCPDQEDRHSPRPTHYILPTLAFFLFKGVNEYLEELVSRIDAPRLFHLEATFFNDIDFDIPEFIRFVSRSSALKPFNEAHVSFDSRTASVGLQAQAPSPKHFKVEISCREPDWQLSSLAQICTSSLPLLSTTESLYICEHLQSQLDWKDGIENTEWLELLLPFTAVKDLYLSKKFAARIAPALQELTAGRTEVLPTLQNLFLEEFKASEPVHEGIGQFVSARQLTNRPITISVWKRMASSSSSSFRSIFNATLQAYENETKIKLLDHPLAAQLQSCDSPNAILSVFQDLIQQFDQRRTSDERLKNWLDSTVNVLCTFSATLGEGVGLTFSPAKVIFVGIGVLLFAAKDVNMLVDFFERIESLFKRLESCTELKPSEAMTDMMVKIMVEVLSVLATVTVVIKKRRRNESLEKLLGRNNDALKRLDKLTQEEAKMMTAEVLEITRGMGINMRVLIDDGKEARGIMQQENAVS